MVGDITELNEWGKVREYLSGGGELPEGYWKGRQGSRMQVLAQARKGLLGKKIGSLGPEEVPMGEEKFLEKYRPVDFLEMMERKMAGENELAQKRISERRLAELRAKIRREEQEKLWDEYGIQPSDRDAMMRRRTAMGLGPAR
jgi:hypothetical protein